MSFLSPWFLLGLLGIGIPLAIHMIRKRKATKVVFSTVRFLKKTPKKMIFFQEVQQWLLLAMRALIFVLLAIAFARPFFGNLPETIGLAPQSVVILLDTSMSMQYGDHFQQAKDATLKILQSLQHGDEAAIVTFSDSTRQFKSLTRDLTQLELYVNRLAPPDNRTTRSLPALRFADQILRSARYPDRTVHLISDYQRHAFENLNSTWQLSPGVQFVTTKVGQKETTNLAITDVKSPHQVLPHQKNYTILGRIRSGGSQIMTQATVSLRINEKIVATQEVDLTDKSEAIVEFQTQFEQPQTYLGAVTVEDDRFPADNAFYFTINVPTPIKILGINGEASTDWYKDESHWFRLAFGEKNEAAFQLDIAEPSQLNAADFDAYKIIVLLNVVALNPSHLKALESYVARGGTLLFAPGDQVNAEGFNRLFSKIAPATLETPHSADKNYLVIADINQRHPIFRLLQSTETHDFGTAKFYGHWETIPQENSEVLMRFDNGHPALIEKSLGNGKTMLYASSLDAEWNDFPLQVMYLPLLHETFRYLAQHEEKQSSYAIGEAISLRIPSRTLVHVVAPQGQKRALTPKAGERHFYNKTEHPGFYKVQSNTFEDHFAVNVPAAESNLNTIAPQVVQEMVNHPETKPQASPEVQTAFYKLQLEKSQRFWWWILLLVFLLTVGETLLANRTYR